MNKSLKDFFKFSGSSLSATALDLGLYNIVFRILEPFTELDLFIATWVARLFSESAKYQIDKKAVFNSNNKGYLKYILLSIAKTFVSASLVTLIDETGIEYETLVKCAVDSALFVPNYLICKSWVHQK